MRIVTKLNRKSLRALEKSRHHNVPGKNPEVLGVVHSARLRVICQHFSWGKCGIQILTSVRTFRQRISHHQRVHVSCGAVTNSKDTTIKLHSARCCLLAPDVAPRIQSPMIFIGCTIFGPGSGFVIMSTGLTFVPTFFVTNLLTQKLLVSTSSACRRVLPCTALCG